MTHALTIVILALAALTLGGCVSGAGEPGRGAPARPTTPGLHAFRMTTPEGELPYHIWLPQGYDRSKRWPLIVFFHGSGESGVDGSRPIWQGLGLALLQNPERFPAIVAIPQKPDKRQWTEFDAMVLPFLDALLTDWPVDRRRVVYTGVSQGGRACWHFGAMHADRVAALAPAAAFALTPEQALALARTPIWLSHGGQDTVIPESDARTSVERLRAAGNEPTYTLYPEAGHVSWNEFYGDPKVAAWLVGAGK